VDAKPTLTNAYRGHPSRTLHRFANFKPSHDYQEMLRVVKVRAFTVNRSHLFITSPSLEANALSYTPGSGIGVFVHNPYHDGDGRLTILFWFGNWSSDILATLTDKPLRKKLTLGGTV